MSALGGQSAELYAIGVSGVRRSGTLFVLLIIFGSFWVVPLHAAPSVEGFSSVPWGASHEQVRTVMTEKGFVFLQEIKSSDLYSFDRYKGDFAGYAAELRFYYYKDVFYRGAAVFLDVLNSNSQLQCEVYYESVKKLFVAKYGRATTEQVFSDGRGNWVGESATWNALQAEAKPQGQVTIIIKSGRSAAWHEIDLQMGSRLIVMYDLGEAWGRLKSFGGNI